MIDLAQRSEPYEIALPHGLSVTVKPLTTAGMAATQAAARRVVEAIERQASERTEAGLPLDGLPRPLSRERTTAATTPSLHDAAVGHGRPVGFRPAVPLAREERDQPLMKASRAGLITSAWVVHMPCGNFSCSRTKAFCPWTSRKLRR